MVDVYEFLLPDGTITGCGTTLEFYHWNELGILGEGARLGRVIGQEPKEIDSARKVAWAA